MASKQLLVGNGTASATVTNYHHIHGANDAATTSNYTGRVGIISTPGVIKNLRVDLSGTPGSGKSHTITLWKNGSATLLTATIADLNTVSLDSTHEISVVAGDTIYIETAPSGTPTSRTASWCMEFIPTTEGETQVLGGTLSNSATGYLALFPMVPGATEGNFQIPIPCAGTFKNFYAKRSTTGSTSTLTLRKNGTNQSLVITFGTSDTTGNDTVNSFTVAAGDLISISISGTSGRVSTGLTFVPNTPGQFIFAINQNFASATSYYGIMRGTNAGSESLDHNIASLCILKAIYFNLVAAPGTGKSFTTTLRKNSTSQALAVTIADAVTNANYSTDISIAANDLLGIMRSSSGTPATTAGSVALLGYIVPSVQQVINANAQILHAGITNTIMSEAAVAHQTQENLTSEASIIYRDINNIVSDAQIIQVGVPQTISSDAYISHAQIKTISSDAQILATETAIIDSLAYIQQHHHEVLLSDAQIIQVGVQQSVVSEASIKLRQDVTILTDSSIKAIKRFYGKLSVTAEASANFIAQLQVSQSDPINPSNVQVVDLEQGDSLELLWTDSGNYGYNVYKDVGGVWVKQNNTIVLGTSYICGALVTGVQYTLKVVGVNGVGSESSGVSTIATPTLNVTKYSTAPVYTVTIDDVPLTNVILNRIELVYGPQFCTADFYILTRPDTEGYPTVNRQEVKISINGRRVFIGYLVKRENKWSATDLRIAYHAIGKLWKYTWDTINSKLDGAYSVPVKDVTGYNNLVLSRIGAPIGLPERNTVDAGNIEDSIILDVMDQFAKACGSWLIHQDALGNVAYYEQGNPQYRRTYTVGVNILEWNDTEDLTEKVDRLKVVGNHTKMISELDRIGGGFLVDSIDPIKKSQIQPAEVISGEWVGINGYCQDGTGQKFYLRDLLVPGKILKIEAWGKVNKPPEVVTPQTVQVTGNEQEVPLEVLPGNVGLATWPEGGTQAKTGVVAYREYEPTWTSLSVEVKGQSSDENVGIDYVSLKIGLPILYSPFIASYAPIMTIVGSDGNVSTTTINTQILEKADEYAGEIRVIVTYEDSGRVGATAGEPVGLVGRSSTASVGNLENRADEFDATEDESYGGYLSLKAQEDLSRINVSSYQGTMTILGDETLELRTQVNGLEVVRIIHDFTKGFITTIDLGKPQHLQGTVVAQHRKESVAARRQATSEQAISKLKYTSSSRDLSSKSHNMQVTYKPPITSTGNYQ